MELIAEPDEYRILVALAVLAVMWVYVIGSQVGF
jgi:hypothetical protein